VSVAVIQFLSEVKKRKKLPFGISDNGGSFHEGPIFAIISALFVKALNRVTKNLSEKSLKYIVG
jgi:hypothetical protein